MSITNELRRWAYSMFAHTIFSNLEKKVDEIADRIDAEHRAAIEKLSALIDNDTDQYLEGYNEASDFFASEIEDLRHRVGIIERKLNHRGER